MLTPADRTLQERERRDKYVFGGVVVLLLFSGVVVQLILVVEIAIVGNNIADRIGRP